jgi:hypothetical protein
MRPRLGSVLRLLVGLGVVGLALAACGGKGGAGANFPAYTGHPTELFDDGIDPIAVGYQLEPGPPPAGDAKLRERVQTADAVVRAKVTTVTSKKEDTGRSWQLGMHLLGRLAGSGKMDDDFSLDVESTDQGAGMVKAFEANLVGATFVVAAKTFAKEGAPGESDLHFHLSADKPDVLAAIKQAVLLEQVR